MTTNLRLYMEHCLALINLGHDEESHNALTLTIEQYYSSRKRVCYRRSGIVIHTSVIDGRTLEDGYSVKYIIDRKHFFQYFIPIDTRNFFAHLSFGIGPEYESMYSLVSESNQSKFSMESTTEAVANNLAMLDEYLAGRLK
jgi:hypothetical protein